jgi:hypothetical protein
MIFSESHQPEVYCCHAGMADESDSFSGCFETRLPLAESFGRQAQDVVRVQDVCACHGERYVNALNLGNPDLRAARILLRQLAPGRRTMM